MPTPAYDPNNVFARILRGEIPTNKKLFEDEHTLAFWDIAPAAPLHALVIPKGAYTDYADFSARASEAEIVSFVRATGQVAKSLGADEEGYRLISNCGQNAHQDVPHFHVHILGGRKLGPLLMG
jgi:histidine triad (HIT) family protein